jgi:hypothetical protein
MKDYGCCIHADAYSFFCIVECSDFILFCEKESFEIHIWVELKVICKLENSLENRKGFSPRIWPWAETPPGPAWLLSFPLRVARVAIQCGSVISCSPVAHAGPAGLHRHHGAKAKSELIPCMEFIPFWLILTEVYLSRNEGSKQLCDQILFEIRPKPLYIGDHIARIFIRNNRIIGLEQSSSCDLISPPPVQLALEEARVGHKEAVRAILRVWATSGRAVVIAWGQGVAPPSQVAAVAAHLHLHPR